MNPTDKPTAGPGYSELFHEGAFGQRPMIGGRSLREEAARRGHQLPLFPRKDVLEPLDQLGAFSPIGFSLTNFTPETTWLNPDPDLMVWREERNPQPWESYSWIGPGSGHPYVSERYSHWQLLYLGDVLVAGRRELPAANVFSPNLRLLEPDDWLARRVAEVRDLDERWRPTVKLLVALQARFWPHRKQRVTLLHQEWGGKAIDQLEVIARTFDPLAVLRRFEMGLSDLAALHYSFLETAARLDPTPHMIDLFEMAPRARTDQVRGEALRTRDLYDAAYLLRFLYWTATERWLPLSADSGAIRTVEEYRRRHLPRVHEAQPDDRTQLKQLLIGEGLYPHMLHVFVEGDTEEIVVTGLLRMLGRTDGTQVTNLRGVDQAERYSALFAAATEYAARTVLIADREGSLTKVIPRLRSAGILAADDDLLLWERDGEPSNFEEANFTYGEIVQAIRSAGKKRGALLTLTAPTLRNAHREAIRNAAASGRTRPPVAKFALHLAASSEHGHVVVSKRELAEELLAILARRIRAAGDLYSARERRPLLGRLWFWLAN